jgi:hypothetical protein
MADERIIRPDSSDSEEEREQGRRTSELDQQEDLNQGMTTGTHNTERHGVDWGRSYRTKVTEEGTSKKSSNRQSGTDPQNAQDPPDKR